MSFVWDHFNYHVTDTKASVAFYEKTLGMKVIREMGSDEGPSHFIMMGYDDSNIVLELKWVRDHEGAYNTGDQAYHVCVKTDDIASAMAMYREMGIITQEMGDHGCFIKDPDGHLVEVLAK